MWVCEETGHHLRKGMQLFILEMACIINVDSDLWREPKEYEKKEQRKTGQDWKTREEGEMGDM